MSIFRYSQKIDKTPEDDTEIDNLFGNLFQCIETLCSNKVYTKPEQAEADVLKILNFMLLKERFYDKYLNDLIMDKRDEDKKVKVWTDIWYESGEDRIYESISKVFRESLSIRKENIKDIIPYLIAVIRNIYNFYNFLANNALKKERAKHFKDSYDGRVWYPFKQLFSILGLSVFSKSLMVELHKVANTGQVDVPVKRP